MVIMSRVGKILDGVFQEAGHGGAWLFINEGRDARNKSRNNEKKPLHVFVHFARFRPPILSLPIYDTSSSIVNLRYQEIEAFDEVH